MFADLKQVSGNKVGFLTALYCLFVPFSILMSDYACAMFVVFQQKAVPFILEVGFRLIGIVVSAVFFQLSVKRIINSLNNTSNKAEKIAFDSSFLKTSDNQKSASLLHFLSGICLIEILGFIMPVIIKMNFNSAFFVAIVLLAVVAALFALFLQVSWWLAYENAEIKGYARVFTKSIQHCFKKPLFLLMLICMILLSITVGYIIYSYIWDFLKSTAISASLALFYRYVMLASFVGFVMLFTMKLIHVCNTKVLVTYEPKNKTTQYQEPQYQVSQYQPPQTQEPHYQTTQYQAPQYQPPQTQEPQYQTPQYQAPQYQPPQTQEPQYQTPQYQVPQYQTTQIQAPQYQTPQYQIPQNQTTQNQAPQFQALQFQAPQSQTSKPPRLRKPILGLILLALFTIGTIYSVLPVSGSIENEIEVYCTELAAKAEEDRNADKLYLCGIGYKRAYAVSQAFEGYLYHIQTVSNKKMTDEDKTDLLAKANNAFTNATTYWPNSGLIFYLDAMRQRESSPTTSITRLEQAIQLSPEWYDSYFELIKLYNANNMKDKSAGFADKLIKAGVYSRSRQLDSIGSGTADRLLDQHEASDTAYMENFATIAISYYESQLFPEAMAELTLLKQVMPENLAVNYLIALTDLEIKQDLKRYDDAINASQTILKQFPNEQWAQDFATGIAMRAGNQSVMETSLESSFAQNPDNPDIAEQYAYSLLRKNTDFSYSEAAQQAESIINGILAKDPQRWFSLYSKAVIDLLKRDYSGSLDQLSKFTDAMKPEPGLFTIYDDLYTLYVYKYEYLMQQDAKATEALEMIKDTNLLAYQYIYGAYFWKTVDYIQSEEFLKATIYLAPEFSKPYFMLGNVYFEMAGTQNKPEYYPMAEEMYRQSLVIFPEDPYTWFSLAHVLKKTERYDEAIGAFQKTLVYMPTEDHNTDHFGVSVHSFYQIQEISALLKQKEGQ